MRDAASRDVRRVRVVNVLLAMRAQQNGTANEVWAINPPRE
jgi:hypothetical protein